MELDPKLIRIDGGTQLRVQISDEAVGEYAEAMKAGAKFPAVTVFFDGTNYWLADGFHRVLAARQIGLPMLEVDVRDGTPRDALLFGIGANANHGVRRTKADKRKAITVLLEDPEWSQWSNREIARRACVDPTTVLRVRESLSGGDNHHLGAQPPEATAKRLGSDGKLYPAAAPVKVSSTEEQGEEQLDEGDEDVVEVVAVADDSEASRKTFRVLKAVRKRAVTMRKLLLEARKVWEGVLGDLDRNDRMYVVKTDKFRALSRLDHQLLEVAKDISKHLPYALCPACSGHPNSPDCITCKRSGWVTKAVFQRLSARKA
jgi:hypothetical protein